MRIIPAIALYIVLVGSVFAKDYLGAELFTNEAFRYGRFEARMLMPAGSGLVSSMFLYYNDSYLGSPEPWCEIDMEVLGKTPDSFQSNIITGYAAKKTTSELHHVVSPATNATYHTYAIEWTPDSVVWYLDDVQVRKTTGAQVTSLQAKDENLRFNLWASEATGWVGTFDPSILPVYQIINWIKVYNYTPGTGTNGSNFTLAWQDNFDSFDTDRWGSGDWTFDDNYVYFSPSNINVQDGYLVLSLTTNASPGFSGTIPADDGSTPTLRPAKHSSLSLQHSSVRWFDLLGRGSR